MHTCVTLTAKLKISFGLVTPCISFTVEVAHAESLFSSHVT